MPKTNDQDARRQLALQRARDLEHELSIAGIRTTTHELNLQVVVRLDIDGAEQLTRLIRLVPVCQALAGGT